MLTKPVSSLSFTAFEGIINQLDRKYVCDKKEYSQLIAEQEHVNFCRASGQDIPGYMNDDTDRLKHIKINEKKMSEGLAMIEKYYNQLPSNYHTITPSASQINITINHVFQLLSLNKTGEAQLHYLKIPQFSPFLKLAFPDLQAMKHQLRAIFCLVSTNGYIVLPERLLYITRHHATTNVIRTFLQKKTN